MAFGRRPVPRHIAHEKDDVQHAVSLNLAAYRYDINTSPSVTNNTPKVKHQSERKEATPILTPRLDGEIHPRDRISKTAHVNTQRSLIVSLRISYYLFSPKLLKQYGFQQSNKTIWPYKSHKFKLGHNPWQGLGFPKPAPEIVREVHRRLSEYHERYDFGSFVNVPTHTTTS